MMESKYQEPKTMQELHKIREEHYEATKNMSFDELMRSIEDEALKVKKEYNLKFKVAKPKHWPEKSGFSFY